MSKQNYITLSGKIENILPVESFASGFKKQDVWLCIEAGKYPNVIPVTFKKDKIGELNGWKKGDEVTISGFLSGRIWDGKGDKPPRCFLGFDGWKVAEYKQGAENNPAQDEAEPEAESIDDVEVDNMPF